MATLAGQRPHPGARAVLFAISIDYSRIPALVVPSPAENNLVIIHSDTLTCAFRVVVQDVDGFIRFEQLVAYIGTCSVPLV